MEWLSFCATTFDPFTASHVYGVREKFVDNLFHSFVCPTRTSSPSLIPVHFVARRSFIHIRFPTSFAFSSFVLAFRCRFFNTLEFRVSVGSFSFIHLLHRNCAGRILVVE